VFAKVNEMLAYAGKLKQWHLEQMLRAADSPTKAQ
jgi:hypothetical protein